MMSGRDLAQGTGPRHSYSRSIWRKLHWSTYQSRVDKFPETQWVKNIRYVADGKIVSSAGISAAMPVSIAVVEAIAGTERAEALAKSLGVGYWGTRHNSDVFRITLGDGASAVMSSVFHARQEIGVRVAHGVDEIALSLKAEAYSATFRANVYAFAQSSAPIKTRGGLILLPDMVEGKGRQPDWILPVWDGTPAAHVLDDALDDIGARYGISAARFVVLEAEYPWSKCYADEQNLRRVFLRNFGINPLQYRARFSERTTSRHAYSDRAAEAVM